MAYLSHRFSIMQAPPLLVLRSLLCAFAHAVLDVVLPDCMPRPKQLPVPDFVWPVLVSHFLQGWQVKLPWSECAGAALPSWS